jgi:hypothetical protein
MATATTKSKYRAQISMHGTIGYLNASGDDVTFDKGLAKSFATGKAARDAGREFVASLGADWDVYHDEYLAPVTRPAWIRAIEIERDNAARELEQYKLMVADLRAHVLSAKFLGVEGDGSRKDWIATGDVLRYIDGF